jgi:hypothetical protein
MKESSPLLPLTDGPVSGSGKIIPDPDLTFKIIPDPESTYN